jgi:hypothetical protein
MIRRDEQACWTLIRQEDHALLAAELASRVDPARFRPCTPELLEAIRIHDNGWNIEDDKPALNSRGEPLDVFETPAELAVEVWSRCTSLAMARNPWTALLVSLHVLTLSAHAVSRKSPADARSTFLYNQFQHQQVELQEQLRGRLGLPVYTPRILGIEVHPGSAGEVRLALDLKALQVFDLLSLAICCGEVPFNGFGPMPPVDGTEGKKINVRRTQSNVLEVDPWLFDAEPIEAEIRAKRLPLFPAGSSGEIQSALKSAPEEKLLLTFTPRETR